MTPDDRYEGSYFGEDRNPLDRMGLSGYERYDRDTSNANIAAYLLWRFLPVRNALDVGCAMGFVVEAIRELGIDARGIDLSEYAISHGAQGAVGHLSTGNFLEGLAFDDAEFDLVSVLEVLEHLPPDAIPAALRELRRVTRHFVVATIPSFGSNEFGPGGWFQVKARDDRVAHFESLGPDYGGPLPLEDIYRDKRGEPIEGHLTLASFSWWTERFEEAGLIRCGDIERLMHPHLARFGMTKYWNIYVFRTERTQIPQGEVRPRDQVIEREALWGLEGRIPLDEDANAVRSALGNEVDFSLFPGEDLSGESPDIVQGLIDRLFRRRS